MNVRSKKCKYAVLSDAPFVKHDGNMWHKVRTWLMFLPASTKRGGADCEFLQECYTCSYCEVRFSK